MLLLNIVQKFQKDFPFRGSKKIESLSACSIILKGSNMVYEAIIHHHVCRPIGGQQKHNIFVQDLLWSIIAIKSLTKKWNLNKESSMVPPSQKTLMHKHKWDHRPHISLSDSANITFNSCFVLILPSELSWMTRISCFWHDIWASLFEKLFESKRFQEIFNHMQQFRVFECYKSDRNVKN